MVNVILYKSSVICTILHFIGYMVFKPNNNLLLATIILGLFTSLWNHTVTCNIAKYADRVMMIIGYILNFYIIYTLQDKYLALLCLHFLHYAVFCYFNSKMFNLVMEHVNSHFLLTINHLFLMEYFSNYRKMIIIYINVP